VYCVESGVKSHHITLFKECHVNHVSKVSPSSKLTNIKTIHTENNEVARNDYNKISIKEKTKTKKLDGTQGQLKEKKF
jgi:hypothetical protein